MTEKTETDLECEQRQRLLELFHAITTYDDREKVIELCKQVELNQTRRL